MQNTFGKGCVIRPEGGALMLIDRLSVHTTHAKNAILELVFIASCGGILMRKRKSCLFSEQT